jgi:hypothetical protein
VRTVLLELVVQQTGLVQPAEEVEEEVVGVQGVLDQVMDKMFSHICILMDLKRKKLLSILLEMIKERMST